jgi:hypothetical protein
VKSFTISLFSTQHQLGCPCCPPDVNPSAVLKNQAGVTKVDLISGLTDALYEDTLPPVYHEPEPLHMILAADNEPKPISDGNFRDDSGVMIFSYNWMIARRIEGGAAGVYGDEHSIILYCCPPDQYALNRKKEHDAFDRADNP